jgi:UDP-N-acetyl-D-galactosamine dehydrogenase
MILAGRRINDQMGKYIAEKTVKMLIGAEKQVRNATIAVLGITFKENVPDLRNTKVVDIISELQDYGVQVIACDPLADAKEAKRYYNIDLQPLASVANVDGVIVTVLHTSYVKMGLGGVMALCADHNPIVIDVKGAFDEQQAMQLGVNYWRL